MEPYVVLAGIRIVVDPVSTGIVVAPRLEVPGGKLLVRQRSQAKTHQLQQPQLGYMLTEAKAKTHQLQKLQLGYMLKEAKIHRMRW